MRSLCVSSVTISLVRVVGTIWHYRTLSLHNTSTCTLAEEPSARYLTYPIFSLMEPLIPSSHITHHLFHLRANILNRSDDCVSYWYSVYCRPSYASSVATILGRTVDTILHCLSLFLRNTSTRTLSQEPRTKYLTYPNLNRGNLTQLNETHRQVLVFCYSFILPMRCWMGLCYRQGSLKCVYDTSYRLHQANHWNHRLHGLIEREMV